ncbi:MAG: metallo-mystery pair system four-Cys motif protein, partial [Kofleriaceae bacterium]
MSVGACGGAIGPADGNGASPGGGGTLGARRVCGGTGGAEAGRGGGDDGDGDVGHGAAGCCVV